MTVALGCIADDFTGASDLASTLVAAGMRTVQVIGVPRDELTADPRFLADTDAVVVALGTRTVPAAEAVRDSMEALGWLKTLGARQIYFKYCSTFDSTDAGNIGPVADALLDGLGASIAVVCPAFPDNRRTVYQGHLFVGDRLLSESSMRHHPLTPMADADLVRVLGRQTTRKVGLIPLGIVQEGTAAIRAELGRLREGGITYAVVDAISNEDLNRIAGACADLALVTAASGLARGLPQNFAAAGAVGGHTPPAGERRLPHVGGQAAILAGSCSEATQRQVAEWSRTQLAVHIDPLANKGGAEELARAALAEADRLTADGAGAPQRSVLFFSSASPQQVATIQKALGRDGAASLIERTFALLAGALVARGVRRLVIAGGETSGTVLKALNVQALTIGPSIAPGVPWTTTLGDGRTPRLALALKSGNFGGPDFFERALEMAA